MSATDSSPPLRGLVLGAIGVVFGDIGTSPLYALKETFAGHHPIPVTADAVLGVLSLVFWTIMVLVSLKYVIIIMRADNRGEGGSLALLALVTGITRNSRVAHVVALLGVFAAALFFGDSMITPAISVLSAVEGLEVLTPRFTSLVLPITLLVLTGLFAIQRRGTGLVGMLFGPVMCAWFGVLAVLGLLSIAQRPEVLMALNPVYAQHFLAAHPWLSFLALGAIVLAVTGGEALYTDMGHFGKFPIRLAWFGLIMPALVINYFGQGALLLADPAAVQNPFYLLAPGWALLPLVLLATAATVIASQAVISGAFSVARQAVQLGYLPRMVIVQTSGEAQGQIYVPFTNWTLYLAVMALVVGFQSSSNLAAAYGIAVTGTMMIDTILVGFVMVLLWRWHWLVVAVVIGGFLVVDLAFFSANAVKIPQGGWFPLAIGLVSFTVLTTWKRGRQLLLRKMTELSVPLKSFMTSINGDIPRPQGTAVFMTGDRDGVPPALLHNLSHNHVLHSRVLLVTVVTEEHPLVAAADRLELTDLGKGFYRLIIKYGFMEQPDIPAALQQCATLGLEFDLMTTSFFVSREIIIPSLQPGMAMWREHLFKQMSKNATTATEFFHIPTDRVVELGTQVEI
ncbi:potassium transporter Kup [uncultured Thiodictyon sp.]|uniref:potassium transporter Kup n=1 Tax=uncultured Thiodictyon sp. TaxID=1846217 RepID=UPI0025D06773|nr:potassium transporter Kup [uncultured Thiodictyon sp.]